LSEALASVDTPAGRKRVADVLSSQPYPHYKQYSGQSGLLVRTDEDGTQTVGRFVNRVFVATEANADLPNQACGKMKLQAAKKSLRTKAVPARSKAKLTSQSKEREAWV
jgi:hypothetical protein